MIRLQDITVTFGGIVALDAISADFSARVSGIIGPNGAGKTTTMNVISGFIRCDGRIECDGEDINRLSPAMRTRWGLRRSFQREQIAPDLSVLDNLRVIQDHVAGSRADKRAELAEAIKVAGLQGYEHRLAGELNTFERRLTDIARCLIGKPKIVMLDEPGGGLTRDEAGHLGELILQIPEYTEATTLVIDHDVDLIKHICSETLVLDFGKRIAFGETQAVLDDPKVQAAYLGIEEVAS